MPELLLADAPAAVGPADDLLEGAQAFFAARADALDAGEDDVREGLRRLASDGLLDAGLPGPGAPASPERAGEVMATVAEACMSSAFSLWCHRMVLEYLARAEAPAFPRAALLGRLGTLELVGSTALGAAMAHLVAGSPLTLSFRRAGDTLELDGRVPWASNLFAPDFLLVTAASDAAGNRLILAVPGDAAGVRVEPYPELLALQATASSSVRFDGVRVPAAWVVTDDFARFLQGVRPTFLLLQAAFCRGLAAAALRAARAAIGGVNLALEDDLVALEARFAQLVARHRELLRRADADAAPMRAFVQLRLELAQVAGAATRLEAAVQGGRGYARRTPTARRLREAAFLPVQAPTEGLLRWELSR